MCKQFRIILFYCWVEILKSFFIYNNVIFWRCDGQAAKELTVNTLQGQNWASVVIDREKGPPCSVTARQVDWALQKPYPRTNLA